MLKWSLLVTTQTDVSNTESGLSNVELLFSKINGIRFCKKFKSQDVVRHKLMIKEIIKAYEKNGK